MSRETAPAGLPVPPEAEVQRVYQPVEVRAGGDWALGRINAWWTAPGGERLCRVRVLGASGRGVWRRYDPERIVVLPVAGL